ncbi:hypothetical protein [uncultured Pseudomonas sp.]|uniref:hypothetical protein n=1 Tax=uncultured Pseudomonas sp. TaxID=114707 RepID=UPI0025E06750|nr:hypothetical protein [uncultured Pseudomonas sp.]
MVGITGVNFTIQGAQSSAQASGDSEQTTAKANTVEVQMPTQASKAEQAKASEQSDEPMNIKQLRELIKQLQKQLDDAQKRLAEIQAQPMDEKVKMAALSGAQGQIANISAQYLKATAALLQALNQSGGSRAGGMVNTQA